jgi:hypothetical protein
LTLDQLFGIKGPADYKFISALKHESWGAEFDDITHPHLIVGGHDYGKIAATEVTFEYEGSTIKNTSHSPLLLGEFKIWEDDYDKMPVLPAGSHINITYDYKTKDSKGSKVPFFFTVVPEPSSFVVAALAGSCATAAAFSRKRRRRA